MGMDEYVTIAEGCFHGNFASLLKPEALRRGGDVVEDTVLSSSSQGRPILRFILTGQNAQINR